jgi:hypothetical protein
MEAGVLHLPVTVNDLKQTKKKEKILDRPIEPIHEPAEPI